MFTTGVSFIRNAKKLFAGVDASPSAVDVVHRLKTQQ